MNALVEVKISRSALRYNVDLYRKMAPGSLFMAVIKSNAYGHGAPEVVRSLRGSVDWFAVNSLEEASEVRKHDSQTPILVMGAVDRHADLAGLLGRLENITLVVSSIDAIQRMAQASPLTPFHLKVDTGMSRLGVHDGELTSVLRFLKENPDLPWTGLMTHFADVEDVTEQQYAKRQLDKFLEAKAKAQEAAMGRNLIFHAAASAAAMVLPESRLDMIRVGIALYGLWPSRSTRISLLHLAGELKDLRPALTWQAPVVHLNHVEPGITIGYGRTYRAQVRTTVAVIPVGYNEGYSRVLSNNAYVLIRGQRARILGRVCMNMIMADVTAIPGVTEGDTATLIGVDGDERITAEELADLSATINYEIVTRIHPDLNRKEVD